MPIPTVVSVLARRAVLRRAAAALALPAALALSGCGPIGPGTETAAPPQTQSQAGSTIVAPGEEVTCQNIGTKLQEATERIESLGGSLLEHPHGALAEIQATLDDLAALGDATTDPGLRERLDAAWAAGDALLQELSAAVQNGSVVTDLRPIGEKSGALVDSIEAIDAYCRAQ